MHIPFIHLKNCSCAISLAALAGCAAQSAPVAEPVHSKPPSSVANTRPLCDPGNVFTSLQGTSDDDTVTADASAPRSVGVRLGSIAGVEVANLQVSVLQASSATSSRPDRGTPVRIVRSTDASAHGQEVTLRFDGRDDRGMALASGTYPIWVNGDIAYNCPISGTARVHLSAHLGNVAVPQNK